MNNFTIPYWALPQKHQKPSLFLLTVQNDDWNKSWQELKEDEYYLNLTFGLLTIAVEAMINNDYEKENN